MLILAAILAIFVYGMNAAMLGTILPDLSDRFKLTPQQNGTIAFMQALGLIIASVAVGPLIDFEGKKIGMILGLSLVTIALFLLPRASGYSSLMLYMFLLGLGGGIIVTGANALGSDVTSASPATTLNLLNLFFGLGGLATPFISANFLKRDPSRLCYLVATLTAVTLILNIATSMPAPSGTASFVFSDIASVLAKPSLMWTRQPLPVASDPPADVPAVREALSSPPPPPPPEAERPHRMMIALSSVEFEKLGIAAVKKGMTRHQVLRAALDIHLERLKREYGGCGCMAVGGCTSGCGD